ncbi:toxin-antitoxin system YwqK family antitoxin [Leeuwenhoekiella polynyae]|uniref:MORN repeat protein n=1 Tax=Leeuwenhoekiella polynyae TaxID=1550906 RepID=A0A4Q0P180_9FLAO|nr:hypothetical protein [Leeuwenhoekiella polynyae]RXG20001.1 hypothetical protein DSM02_2846 [Leeuwenhoekiella polynyae]
MIFKILLCLIGFICISQESKIYIREFDANGNLIAEGWEKGSDKEAYWYYYYSSGVVKAKGEYYNDQKNGYWFYYDKTSRLLREGHYKQDQKVNWWIVYRSENQKEKIQYQNNVKEGYGLLYKNEKLIKANRYDQDKLSGSWTSISQFKKDNPNARF